MSTNVAELQSVINSYRICLKNKLVEGSERVNLSVTIINKPQGWQETVFTATNMPCLLIMENKTCLNIPCEMSLNSVFMKVIPFLW